MFGASSNDKAAQKLDAALAHHRAGRLDEAEALYRELITEDPLNADAHHLMGMLSFARGYYDAAANRIAEAIHLNPRDERYHLNFANVMRAQGRDDDALAALDKAVALNGAYLEAWANRGLLLVRLSRAQEGLESFDAALKLRPDNADLWFHRGTILSALGRLQDALESFDQALALKPDFAAAHYNRGTALTHFGRPADAILSFDAALALKPDDADAHYNRGLALAQLCRWAEALASYDAALALKPQSAAAHNNRGLILAQTHRLDEALDSYRAALKADPDYAPAYNNQGHVLLELKRLPEAIESYQAALRLDADFKFLPGVLLNAQMQICDWQDLDDSIDAILDGLDEGRAVTTPFALLSIPSTLAQQRRCAEIHARYEIMVTTSTFVSPTKSASSKIRVGYFSPDFRSHPVSFLTAGLIESHDRTQFEVYGFSYGPDAPDPLRDRLRKAFDYFIDIRTVADGDVVTLVRELQLDIAVDLAGYTNTARSNIFAARVAPVQVNYLGLPATMGVDFIDYIIADDTMIPEDHRPGYAEKVVIMPDCFQVNDDKRIIPPALTRAAAGLDEAAFVFCSFNNTYKLNPDIFEVWLRILSKTPGSVLWLLGESQTQIDHLRTYAAAQGIDPARLVFGGRVPYAEHMARYQVADLVLDTLPFNGGTTTSDALWGGAPVLTCLGRTYAGRMAASLLKAVGLPELVTTSLDDYEALAVELAQNPARARALKHKLAANRASAPLFKTARFTSHLEEAYSQMVARARAGQPPDHIYVSRKD